MVSSPTLKSLPYFEQNYVQDVQQRSDLFVRCGHPFSPTPFTDQTVLFPCCVPGFLAEGPRSRGSVFLGSQLTSVSLGVIFMSLLCCFDSYSFVIQFEIRTYAASTLFFLHKIVLAFGIFCVSACILGFFLFYLREKFFEILIRIVLNL